MPNIDYFFSPVSVYAYLAGDRLEKIAARHGQTISYRPLDIGQLLKRTGGVLLAERHPNRKAYRLQDLERTAKRLGLPLNLQPAFFPANGAPASYAIIAAGRDGSGDMGVLVRAILRAIFAEDRNIAEDDVIRGALREAGFDPALADKGLFTGAEAYEANLEEAVNRGVFGSPTYFTQDGQQFWGQDRLDDLDWYLGNG